ncbi:MAG: DUF1214 domain-containing protein [Acidobacteriia bacterium]|nr:DUF1214 domain-containing protein [Terriglobia bacterium]
MSALAILLSFFVALIVAGLLYVMFIAGPLLRLILAVHDFLRTSAFGKLLYSESSHHANGPWRIDLSLGTERAGLYTKAVIARTSLFALRPPEVVYFRADHDSAGNPIRQHDSYIIEGGDLDARWWSLTAYRRSRLIPNPAGRHSFSQTTVARRSDGTWRIHFSRTPHPENWLPAGEGRGNLALVLRFYGPGTHLLAHLDTAPLPAIYREAAA